MLIGEYTHTIDDKNRLSFPSKFRKEMGKTVVVTHGLDNCLFVFTTKEWGKFAQEVVAFSLLKKDNRSFNRYFLGGAVEVPLDTLGRLLLPDFLKQKVGITNKVCIVGVHSRVELWSEDTWKTYKASVESGADELSEKLSNLGVL
jgi:MraZ protein